MEIWVRDTRSGMQQGEESAETPAQVSVQTAAASESVDGSEKETAEQVHDQEESGGEEEEQVGTSWGHAKLPGDVYGSSPFLSNGRNKHHVVWDAVKLLKKHTAEGTTVNERYTHVCVARISAEEAGEEGDDEDGEGNWRYWLRRRH